MPRKANSTKDDATGELEPGEPTQETAKGLKIGVPKREDVLATFAKVAKPPKPAA